MRTISQAQGSMTFFFLSSNSTTFYSVPDSVSEAEVRDLGGSGGESDMASTPTVLIARIEK